MFLPRLAFLLVTGTICFAAVPVPDSLGAARVEPSWEHTSDISPSPAGVPSAAEFARLAKEDPVAMLESCCRRLKSELHTYRTTMIKRERVRGELHPEEEVIVTVRESPYGIRMHWNVLGVFGFLFAVEDVLYAAGENEGKLIVRRPSAIVSTLPVSPTDDSARNSSRICICEAGLVHAAERTRRAWTAARDAGRLHVEYQGIKPIDELGGRKCHVLKRTCVPLEVDAFMMRDRRPKPEEHPKDAFQTVTVMIDAETWIQTGAELRRPDGELIAAYWFKDVEINLQLSADLFKGDAFRAGK